jgi:hypothetical protein
MVCVAFDRLAALATKRRVGSFSVATIARWWIGRKEGLRSIPAPGGVGYEEKRLVVCGSHHRQMVDWRDRWFA